MEPTLPDVTEYLTRLQLGRPRHPVALEMERLAEELSFPIIGPLVGAECYREALLMDARSVFELGSGFGYSTYWFARAVAENGGGTVHHVVWDDELSNQARGHLTRAGLAEQVAFHVGEAVATLERQTGPFDVIFMDIDKQGYPDALSVIMKKLRPGGLLIVDNMLWKGKVLDPASAGPSTAAILELTRLVFEDEELVPTISPIRDGVLFAWRRGRARA